MAGGVADPWRGPAFLETGAASARVIIVVSIIIRRNLGFMS
jgi:hypothetical protein